MQIKYLTVGSLIALSCANNISYSENARNTYIGVGYLSSSNKMQKDFGDNIFYKKNSPGLNFSLGHMYTENIGGEIGLEINKIKSQTKDIPEQETVCGVPPHNPLHIFSRHKTKITKNNTYLGIIARSKIFNSNLFISMLIGGAIINIKAKNYILGNQLQGIPPLIPEEFSPENMVYHFKKTKLIPTGKLILTYKFNDLYSATLSYGWQQTSKIQINSLEIYNNYIEKIKLKNNYSIKLGLYYFI